MDADRKKVYGDILLSCGQMVFYGSLSYTERKYLFQSWISKLIDMDFKFRYDFKLE
jgi:hypothetical protein